MFKERLGALRGPGASHTFPLLTSDRFELRPDNVSAISCLLTFITSHALSAWNLSAIPANVSEILCKTRSAETQDFGYWPSLP